MPVQHLLPVALPRGKSGNTGRITLYFSPRLKQSGILADYPEWMNWPETLARMHVRLGLQDNSQSDWVSLNRVSVVPDLLKWRNLFAAATPVNPHRFVDWSKAPYETVATSEFNEAVLDMYAGIAVAHSTLPPSDDDVFSLPQSRRLNSAVESAVNYLQPMQSKVTDRLEEPADPEWDFHAYISLLGGHPELLRHLGIAVDYEFAFPNNLPVPIRVVVDTDYANVVQNGPGRDVILVAHVTDEFYALPNPAAGLHEQTDGFLELDKQNAYLSILDSFSTATRLSGLDSQQGNISEPVPALITRALTLVRPDLLKAFANRTSRQAKIEEDIQKQLDPATPRKPVDMYAEDVTIGHRIDVLPKNADASQWRSLFDRQTDANGYQFTHANDSSLNVHPDPDEGWCQTLLVTELVEDLSSQIGEKDEPLIPYAIRRLDDQLYRWDGWSGAVGRPDQVLDGVHGKAVGVAPQLPISDTAVVQFAASYESVPGTLLRLRFGDTYIMRARCVNLAGNSVDLKAVNPDGTATQPTTFGRLEPIAAPFIVRRTQRPYPGIGDEATNVVLLGDYDIDDSTIAAQERLLFPSRVGQDLCELHGEPKGGVNQESYAELVERDAKAPEDQWQTDSESGEPVAQGSEHHSIDYLSDPLIHKLRAFRWGANGGEYLVDIIGSWPATESTRIEVVAGESATEVNPDSNTEIRFSITKADIVAADLSYGPRDGGVEEFGLWHRFSAEDQNELFPIIARGGHWMFSARRPVRMVYAVRRPLLAPDFEECCMPQPLRGDDDTGVTFDATLSIDRRSTGSVSMRATWTDLVDDLNQDGPVSVDGGAWLGRFDTPRQSDPDSLGYSIINHRAELGDTRRHHAQLHLEAFSYFSSYFTEERKFKLSGDSVTVDERGLAEGSVSVRHGKENLEAQSGVDFTVLSDKGTVIIQPGSAIEPDAELTVRYIPLPVSRTNQEHPAFQVIFPNTATPPPPRIESVIPAAARVAKAESVTHEGRMLRVYLKRPWNVTGDNEALAIMIERNPAGVSDASRLGRDPAVNNATQLPILAPSAFTRASTVIENFDGIHDLAVHDVQYDASSKRWFADVAVATEVYRPFLQLVIARYQADSITGKDLSAAVTLEPIRLGLSRIVTLESTDGNISVKVTGREHAGIPGLENTVEQNEVTLTLQEADTAIADKDLRWTKSVQNITLSRTAGPDGSTWSGVMNKVTSENPRRLLIEEFEPGLFGGEKATLTSHVVYSEVMDI